MTVTSANMFARTLSMALHSRNLDQLLAACIWHATAGPCRSLRQWPHSSSRVSDVSPASLPTASRLRIRPFHVHVGRQGTLLVILPANLFGLQVKAQGGLQATLTAAGWDLCLQH